MTSPIDDEVTTKLACVFGRAPQFSPLPQQACVKEQGTRVVHVAERGSTQLELAVDGSIGVGEQGKWQVEVVAVVRQALRACEGHGGDVSVAEAVDLIAHGDQVFLAGQSHQVAMEDQHHGLTAMIGQRPGASFVVERREVVDWLARVHGPEA